MNAKFFYTKVILSDGTYMLHVCDRVGLRMLKSLWCSAPQFWIQELEFRNELPKGEHVKLLESVNE